MEYLKNQYAVISTILWHWGLQETLICESCLHVHGILINIKKSFVLIALVFWLSSELRTETFREHFVQYCCYMLLCFPNGKYLVLTFLLSRCTSNFVKQSAFAITGTMFTLVCSIFMNVMSMGFNLSKRDTTITLTFKHWSTWITGLRSRFMKGGK